MPMKFKTALYSLSSAAAAAAPAAAITWAMATTMTGEATPLARQIVAMTGLPDGRGERIDAALLRGGQQALEDRNDFLTSANEQLAREKVELQEAVRTEQDRLRLTQAEQEQIQNEVYLLRTRMTDGEAVQEQLQSCKASLEHASLEVAKPTPAKAPRPKIKPIRDTLPVSAEIPPAAGEVPPIPPIINLSGSKPAS